MKNFRKDVPNSGKRLPEGSEFRCRVKEDTGSPINVIIEIKEKGSYTDRPAPELPARTYEKNHYPDRTDTEFASFCEIIVRDLSASVESET